MTEPAQKGLQFLRRGILSERSTIWDALLRVLDLAIVVISGLLAGEIYLGGWPNPPFYLTAHIMAVLLAAAVFPYFALYQTQTWRGASLIEEIRMLTVAWAAVMVSLAVFAFLVKVGPTYSRGWALTWFGIGWTGLVVSRLGLRFFLRWLRRRGYNLRRIVIVGTGTLGLELLRRLGQLPWGGFDVVGMFAEADSHHGNSAKLPVELVGGIDDLAEFVERARIDQVWIALPLSKEAAVRRVLWELRHSTADIRFVPDLFGFRLLNHSISEVAGLPVLNLTSSPMDGMNQCVKAIEDRALALLILLLAGPLMLAIALGVKLSSPGPVLFKQRRLGWDGREITVLKFRSMTMHAEERGRVSQAKRDDPRVTPFGAFLRRSSLDELPQLINVLRGEMSIVGPRPHALEHNQQYKELVEQYMLRHKVKPGITGWAQINGYRGETDTLEKMQKRVEYDLYYIEHWSLWFDLKIILRTLYVVLVNKNAY